MIVAFVFLVSLHLRLSRLFCFSFPRLFPPRFSFPLLRCSSLGLLSPSCLGRTLSRASRPHLVRASRSRISVVLSSGRVSAASRLRVSAVPRSVSRSASRLRISTVPWSAFRSASRLRRSLDHELTADDLHHQVMARSCWLELLHILRRSCSGYVQRSRAEVSMTFPL